MGIQKAKIVDLYEEYAIVFTDTSQFLNVRRKEGMIVGNGIYFTTQDIIEKNKFYRQFALSKRFFQVSAIMALLLVILFTQSFTPMSYAVISVDINPSVQLSIDADLNVIKITGMNPDGENLLKNYTLEKSKQASRVITEILILARDMNFLEADQNEILIAAAIYDDKNEKKEKSLKTIEVNTLIDNILSEVDYSLIDAPNISLKSVTSNAKNIKAAKDENMTIGQYERNHNDSSIKSYNTNSNSIKENKLTPADENNNKGNENNNGKGNGSNGKGK